MNKVSVESTIWINAPRERVWDAITDSAQITKWWGDYWSIPDLTVGAAIQFGTEDDPMTASVAVVDPPREFAIAWPPQAGYYNIAMSMRFVLAEENGGTRVTVTEDGFEALPDDIRQQRIEKTGEGYTTVLASLKEHVEGG
jgi:uncharacterized protein YndB with AHSA1/START domain